MKVRDLIIDKIQNMKEELIDLSNKIHENPELAFEEFKAVEYITEVLEKHGFIVEKGIGGLKTAFRAEYQGRNNGSTVAFLAEYDALPEIGHGCGHNLIAAMAVGAAIGLKEVAEYLDGRIVLLGTPAEEGGGGKIIMLEKGCFDDIDYALMMHPCVNNLICRGGLATRGIKIEYHGKSVHSSFPEGGINALQAVIQTFNMIDHFRALFPLKTNVNGIITNGGVAANIIPDYAACEFAVRADTVKDLNKVVGYIEHIVETVEKLIGVKGNIKKGLMYAERYPNRAIDERLKDNIAQFGIKMEYPDPDMKYGGSDIGNVSLKIPSIHSYIKIADKGVNSHSIDFTKAANSPRAHEQMIKAAMAMALTGYEILTDENLRREIQEEFNSNVPKYSEEELR
ncbi:M20 family metallopeptidase [Tepidimicrobium xylanilyticum]|uniref:Peptidase M20 domain-containing protein 2 n=1 Tax=Tepidimicrobium xylanilyticum TaxID=1123352 RepID=A0A1H3EQA5_9FIRM|nr:M20 family metallopeptidase [Tepidimicrobium xylanilyticum]GMG97398.1 amidohydrolase [Tepidimicrobium xylanilyticum]SDX80144.1 amidohydrolase [Tepidimicrobium xylanilyticum]